MPSPKFSAPRASLSKRWAYGPSTTLGGRSVDVEALLAANGPVRPGLLEKTGFTTLYSADETEDALSLGSNAAEGLGSGWLRTNVDALLHVSSTGTLVAPGNAHLLQARIGLPSEMFLLDINDACTGFVRSIVVADALITSGVATAVLIVASDTYTRLYDDSELKVSPLFSDGASAMVLSARPLDDVPANVDVREWEFLSSVFLSEGGNAGELCITHDSERELGRLTMNGGAVFNFVLRNLGAAVEKLTAGVEQREQHSTDWYIHQGSRAVVNAVEKTLRVPPDSLFHAGNYGNVVQSSIPFQLAGQDDRAGVERVIGLLGFGVGLTMGGALIRERNHRPAAASS